MCHRLKTLHRLEPSYLADMLVSLSSFSLCGLQHVETLLFHEHDYELENGLFPVQWRTQDFSIEGVEAPREVGCGDGCPLPTGGWSGEGLCIFG